MRSVSFRYFIENKSFEIWNQFWTGLNEVYEISHISQAFCKLQKDTK